MSVRKSDLDRAQATLAKLASDLAAINPAVRIYDVSLPAPGGAHGWMINYYLEPQGHQSMSGPTLNDAYILLAYKLTGTETPPF